MNQIFKFKNIFRILLLITPNYSNKDYKNAKEIYKENIKKFHSKNIKLITKINKNAKFSLKIYGMDGTIKYSSKKFNFDKIMKIIDNMPYEKLKKKLSLYEDYNPKTTVPGLGFKDEDTAVKTVKKIEKKPKIYQYQVINTLYNRAKYHPHQTKDMRKAMKIFKQWLDSYKTKKGGKEKYPYLDLKIINYYDKLAEHYNISRKARGLEEPKTTDEGFLTVYKKYDAKNLKDIPVRKNNPSGANWEKTRINRINAKLGQMKRQKLPFFNKDGNPTKMHTILIMWAYSPYQSKIEKIMNNNSLKL